VRPSARSDTGVTQKAAGAALAQELGAGCTKGFGLLDRAFGTASDDLRGIGRSDEAMEDQLIFVVDLAQGPDGDLAPATELTEEGTLGGDGGTGGRMVEGRQEVYELMVAGPDLHGQSPLAGIGQADLWVKILGDAAGQPQTGQTGGGEDRSIIFAVVDLMDPGINVAPDRLEAQVSPDRPELSRAAGAAGADAGARGKLPEGLPAAGNEDVARVFPLRDRCDGEARVDGGSHVLEAVDRKVDRAREERGFKIFDEDASGKAGKGNTFGLGAVAQGADGPNLKGQTPR